MRDVSRSTDSGTPRVGAVVRDAERDRVGVVMAVLAGRVYLRPAGGGVEWDARPEDLLTVDEHAELRARVAEMNAASSGGLL